EIEDHPLRVGRPRYMFFSDSPGCQLARIAAVCIHHEDRFLLETVASKLADTAESDASSVGREVGFNVEAGGGHGVRVAAVSVHQENGSRKVRVIGRERGICECDLSSAGRPRPYFMNPRPESDLLHV